MPSKLWLGEESLSVILLKFQGHVRFLLYVGSQPNYKGRHTPEDPGGVAAMAQEITSRDFPGGPVVKSPRFYCRGHRFDPWSGN